MTRITGYDIYVHTYPGVEVSARPLKVDMAVVSVDDVSIIIRDIDTAIALVDAAGHALAILIHATHKASDFDPDDRGSCPYCMDAD